MKDEFWDKKRRQYLYSKYTLELKILSCDTVIF